MSGNNIQTLRGEIREAELEAQKKRLELYTSGDNIQTLRGQIREAELEAPKKRLVDTFYKEVNPAYGLRPDGIDYHQFRIDDDDKTLYWTPGDKEISISTTRGGVWFLALSTLASRYGVGGTDAMRRSLGLTGYTRKVWVSLL